VRRHHFGARAVVSGEPLREDVFLGTYLLLLMLIILPKLYASYAVTHRVGKDMSGLSH
jgi:hypothetical protein